MLAFIASQIGCDAEEFATYATRGETRREHLGELQAYLNVIEQEVKIIDGDLEGRIKEAGTRANNAYESIKSAVARIRSAAENLKTPSVEIAPTPAAQQEEKSWWASAQA